MKNSHLKLALFVAFCVSGCATSAPEPVEDGYLSVGPEDPAAGKSFFAPTEGAAEGKFDALDGTPGLPVSVDDSSTAVWDVRNRWTDTDTAEARLAGMAWAEDSGLDWNEKYAAWIASMKKIDSTTYFQTYEFITPYGKVLPAPALECAETSIFFRVAFASWYGLPFFLEAKDRNGKRLYLGHFGFRTADDRFPRSAKFKTSYVDYRDRAQTWQTQGWPQDPKLRGRKLGGSQDDGQDFLFEGAHAGAYFDEIFLNKRVGYFMIYALSYFGSMNLADSRNTYNIKARAVQPGDTLLERWKRRGIGHTLVVKSVEQFGDDVFEVDLVSGSMPRRQGKWDETASSRGYFTNPTAGGPGSNDEGDLYAKLGGGLKRWRVPEVVDGRWANMVPASDAEVFISSRDYAALADRIDIFDKILRTVGPDEKRAVLLARIEDQRNHLRRYPASCSARIRREEAFAELYTFEAEQSQVSMDVVDARHRLFEDYVFAELTYEKSKTCCWNSTTDAMYDIVMAYNLELQAEAEAAGECRAPVVFMNREGGYGVFAEYADAIGRGDEWVAWSEDETCPQRDVQDDTEASHRHTAYCDNAERLAAEEPEPESSMPGGEEPVDEPAPTTADDAYEPNDAPESAIDLMAPVSISGVLCPDDDDWFSFELVGVARLDVTFDADLGDIDVVLFDGQSEEVASAESTDANETIDLSPLASGRYAVRIFHYENTGACQPYELSIH